MSVKNKESADYLKKSSLQSENLGMQSNKNYIIKIYKSLSCNVDMYNPEGTISIIEEYIDDKSNNIRLMYSELSNYLFSIKNGDPLKVNYNVNMDRLLDYIFKYEEMESDCKKIVIKLYDHSNLVEHQIEGIQHIAKNISDDALSQSEEKLKESEKQYITILGIFASIVLAFTGGIAFSNSVLSNIDRASIYRLIFVIGLLGFVLFNTICVMFEFVREINEKKIDMNLKSILKKPMWLFPNILLVFIMLFSLFTYKTGFFDKENKIMSEKVIERTQNEYNFQSEP